MKNCGNGVTAYGVITSIGLLWNVWVWDNKIRIPTTSCCCSVPLHMAHQHL